MKRVAIFIAVFINNCVCGQLLFQLTNDSLLAYNYSGGDEFNGNRLNENDWTNGMGWTRVLMSQNVAFSPAQVKFSGGLLNLETRLEDSTYVLTPWEVDSNMIKKEKYVLVENKFRTTHVSGSIISKKKYHYGLYELRFKVDKGKGVWPAFWFYGGYKNEEIDAFELKCEKNNYIHVDTHCPKGCDRGYKKRLGLNTNWGGWLPISDYLHNGFNIVQLEWKPNEVIWHLNGFPLARFMGDFPNPMNLYINSNVAADGRAFHPGPDKTTTWPNNFLVDYVRVWQPTNQENIQLKASPTANLYEQGALMYTIRPRKKMGLMNTRSEGKIYRGFISLNLISGNKLVICITGKLTEDKTVSISLKTNNREVSITDFNKEIGIQLRPSERELELRISSNKKNYIKKITIINQ